MLPLRNVLLTAFVGASGLILEAAAAPAQGAENMPTSVPTWDYESVGTLRSPAVSYSNPLVAERADPHIAKHTDGWYYYTATVPAYDQIILRKAQTIQELASAEEVVIYNRTEEGVGSGQIWAPELHYINGKWYIYVALGVANTWNIRPFVFEGTGDDPLAATWVERSIIETNWDTFSLDATTFVANGVRYLVWAQNDPTWNDTNTALLIAPMINPWTLELPGVPITYPDLPWERIGHNVNEGPYVIKRNGTIFLTYSASATDHNYVVGLLSASETADLMDPASWNKSPVPVFQSNAQTSQWGPGHNSFTVSEDGLSDLIVYHDRGYRDIVGDPLNNPDRRTRVQKLYWRADGTPDFGIPVPDGWTPVRLRLAADETLYIRHHEGGAATVEDDAPLGDTQFRIVSPGIDGEGSVSLESTSLPSYFLRRSGSELVLASDDGSESFRTDSSFEQVAGLAGEEGLSFKIGDEYVRANDSNMLAVGRITCGEEAYATFFTE
ncbi:hypothetical protein S40293_03914 [Stachybotrys chartarum IBT 40293]|nr:hypothetical protein S40293_03914 [Stachybotrys chartarum IBT 40293]